MIVFAEHLRVYQEKKQHGLADSSKSAMEASRTNVNRNSWESGAKNERVKFERAVV